MTPEEVLATLRELAVLNLYPECEVEITEAIHEGATLQDWVSLAYDEYAPLRSIAKNLNASFGIDIPDAQWRSVLTPTRRRMLLDVCQFIAGHATVPCGDPIAAFGVPCRMAGLFVDLRHELRSKRLTIDDLRPGSTLAEFGHVMPVLCSILMKTAPSMVRRTRITRPLAGVHCLMLLLTAVLLLVTVGTTFVAVASPTAFTVSLAAAAWISFATIWYGDNWLARARPEIISFEGMTTFRDLCVELERMRSRRERHEPFRSR